MDLNVALRVTAAITNSLPPHSEDIPALINMVNSANQVLLEQSNKYRFIEWANMAGVQDRIEAVGLVECHIEKLEKAQVK